MRKVVTLFAAMLSSVLFMSVPVTSWAESLSNANVGQHTNSVTTHGTVNIGHLEDTQWNLQDKTSGYKDIEVNIKPADNTFPSDQAYFYANTVWFNDYTGSDYGEAYAGLQTNGTPDDGATYVGKMLVFSVWDAVKAVPVSGGSSFKFTNEGTGYSVRLPYAWQGGTVYRLKIYKSGTSGANTIWAAQVTNQTTNAVQQIGKIYAPTSYGTIYGPVTFHERYLGAPTTCDQVAPSEVTFSNMTANGGALKATAWNEYARQNIPNCAKYFWTTNLSNGYTTAIGP